MGKQVRYLPEETLDEEQLSPNPPEDELDEQPITVKKKESTLPSSSVSEEPVKPLEKSSQESTPTDNSFFGTLRQGVKDVIKAYKTPRDKDSTEPPSPIENAIKRGSKTAEKANVLGLTNEKPNAEKIKELAKIEGEISKLPSSKAYQALNSAKTFTEAATIFASDPVQIIAEAAVESMIALGQHGASRIAVGAAMGSVVPGGTGAGAIAGMAETSLALEFASDFMETLQEAGIDTKDPVALQQAFQNDELIATARSHAWKKSIPVAIFDLISGGLAGKIVAKPAKSLIGKTTQGAAELLVQGGFGATGEAVSQKVAGEELKPGEILLEGLAEFATAPVEATIGATTFNKQSAPETISEVKKDVDAANEPNVNAKAELIQEKVEQMEGAIVSGKKDEKPQTETDDQTTPITSTPAAQEEGAVSEVEAQEDTSQAQEEEAEGVTQPSTLNTDEDIDQAVIPAREDDAVQLVPESEQPEQAIDSEIPQEEGAPVSERPSSRTPERTAAIKQRIDELVESGDLRREADNKVTVLTEKGGQELKRLFDENKVKSKVQGELSFIKTFRGPDDIGGLKGIPAWNQFKLNQGPNFERVQIILSDEQSELYQKGTKAKKHVSQSTKPENQEAIAFANKVNDLARQNRDKNKEVVLDFRPQEDAIQEQIPDAVDVREPSTDGGTLAEGNAERQEPAVQSQAQQKTDQGEVQKQTVTDGTNIRDGGHSSVQQPSSGNDSDVQRVSGLPPVPPKTQTTKEEPSSRHQFRKTWLRIKDDPDISDQIKSGIAKEAKEYVPRSLKRVTEKEANAIIDAKGLDESIKMYMDDESGMSPDVDTAIGINLFDKLQKAENYTDAIRVFEKLSQRGTELGQAVNAYKLIQGKTLLHVVNKSIQKARKQFKEKHAWRGQDAKKVVDDINKTAVEEVLKSPGVKKKVASQVKKGNIKKAIDFLEGLKVDTKGKAFDAIYGLSAEAWNTVITAVQKGLQAGLTISQAINKAVNKVKEPSFQKAAATAYLDDKLKDYRVTLDPEKAVKEELRASGQSIDRIVREHYSKQASTRQQLIDKLIKDANLNVDEATEISTALGEKFDELTRKAKERALKKLLPKKRKTKGRDIQAALNQIIEASNLGALTEEEYMDIIAEKLGVPKLTEQQAKEVQDLTDRVQKAKGDTQKSKAAQDLFNYIENLKGWSWIEAVQAVWYANILSGPTTWLVTNPFANLTNLLAEATIDIANNPKGAGFILSRIAQGLVRGMIQAGDVLKTGYAPFKAEYKTDAKPLLERIDFKGGKINPLNWLKFVGRAIRAGDILFYHPLRQQRLAVMALKEARKHGRTTPNKEDMHNLYEQLLKQDYDNALQQAESEGFQGRDQKIRAYEILEEQLPELTTREADDFAARATFNIRPEGALGALADVLNNARRKLPTLNYVVPFVNTIMNVANEYMNYHPVVGYLRAATGSMGFVPGAKTFRRLSNEERARIALKATIGTVSMAALFLLDDVDDKDSYFEITANGTGNTQKNFELEKNGWRSYSVRIGDKWYSYKNTPLAMPLATIGFLKDAQRYRKNPNLKEELQIMAMGSWRFFQDMSTLSGLTDFLDLLSKENISEYGGAAGKLFDFLEKTVKSVIIPNYFTQISRLVQEFTDSPIKRADDIGDSIIRDVPVARDHLGNLYDAFGDPVIPKQLEKLIPLNIHRTPDDVAMFDFLKDKKLFVGRPSSTNLKPNGTPMTDEEYQQFTIESGRRIKERLKREYKMYTRQKNNEVIDDWFEKVKREERKKAKIKLFGFF